MTNGTVEYDMNIKAGLVYATGNSHVQVPASMGNPRDDQLQGSERDQLAELSGVKRKQGGGW